MKRLGKRWERRMSRLHLAGRWRSFVVALVVALLGLAGTAGPSLAQPTAAFVPHKAIYGLSLARSLAGASSVTQAVGKLEFSWADVCDGWTVSQRTHINLTNLDGTEVEFGWTLSSWESKDGRSYRFFIRRLPGGGEPEDLRGEAHVSAGTGAGKAVFDLPEGLVVALPEETIFPSRHNLVLIEAAQRGAFPVWRVVFDGTGDEGLYGINAALVQALPDSVAPAFDFALIRGLRSWRLNMAHFALDRRDGEPTHEQSLRLYENGVVDELFLDYGDFALDARLAKLEALPRPDC